MSVESKIKEHIKGLGYPIIEGYFERVPAGKMLRSKLIMHIAGKSEQAIALAAVVELIHLASLLHDDVIDESTLRRGAASINALFGNKNAIMLGDILYSKAFFELVSFDKKIAQTISNSVTQLSVGELLDVELSKSFNPNLQAYMDMIYKKTASLIEAASVSAALLCGKDEESFRLYGKNLGLAFQIVDDILDITQDEITLGKPSMSDFCEGKTTIPYIYCYQHLSESDKQTLILLHGVDTTKEQKEWIKDMMHKTGALAQSIELAKSLGKGALEAIESEKNEKLRDIVRAMIEREF